MTKLRYKFDFRDRVSRLRARTAKPGQAVNIKVQVANDPASPSIPAFAELDEEGTFHVTYTDLSGQHSVIQLVYVALLWEIHCRED